MPSVFSVAESKIRFLCDPATGEMAEDYVIERDALLTRRVVTEVPRRLERIVLGYLFRTIGDGGGIRNPVNPATVALWFW